MHKRVKRMMAAIYRDKNAEVLSNAIILLYLQVILAALLAATVAVILRATPPAGRPFYLILTLSAAVMLTLAAAKNLDGSYTASVAISVAVMYLAPWCSVLYERFTGSGDLIPMFYVVIPAQVSALFLSDRAMLPLGAAQVAGFVVLVLTDPARAAYNWNSLILFVLFSFVLGMGTSYKIKRQYESTLKSKLALEESERILRDMSARDALTGLNNRRHMEEALSFLIRTPGAAFGLAMVDIDHYKSVNDQYGHACGDLFVKKLAALLQASLCAGDVACRYGGDEFLLIFAGLTLEETIARAEKLRMKIATTPFGYEGRDAIGITVSVGVSAYPMSGADRDSVLRAADRALYAAKHSGRNRVCSLEGAEGALTRQAV